MGGAISLLFSIRKKPDIRGLILSAPTISLDGHVSRFLRKISVGLGKYFPKLATVKLDINATSRDAKVIEDRKNDPLVYHGRILARTGAELIRATKMIKAEMEQVSCPLLILHGESDRMVNIKGSQELYDRAKEYDKTLKVYEGFYHELFNDLGREQVFQDIADWMDDRIRTAER
jgi:alpha-beta hydrolase superfamily lysophospholipase